MDKKSKKNLCCCPCHGVIKIHSTVNCDCGKPVQPPQPCGQPSKHPECPPQHPKHPTCPLPEPKCQPGTVDIPQPPPFKTSTSSTPPWSQGKPKPGDPDTIPWFKAQVGQILRKGPTFGPRKDEFLPYLLIRSASGDRGARPFNGVFWESPDIFVNPNQEATIAPLMPPTSAGVAQANVPNTLYAHVWNLGKSPAYRVRVEFYWLNPTLGISRSDANLIGAAWIDLANRFTLLPHWDEVSGPSGKYMTLGSHAIVRCPETWIPKYENQGHECLVVRAFEPVLDPLGNDQFSAASDRHVAQRNIAVVQAASPAAVDLSLSLGYAEAPADAEVEVEMTNPDSMEWLKLYTGKRDPGLKPPSAQTTSGFLPPTAIGGRTPNIKNTTISCRQQILRPLERFHRGCDPLQIPFHASIEDIGAKQAQILRIRQRINGSVVGGYSIVLIGR